MKQFLIRNKTCLLTVLGILLIIALWEIVSFSTGQLFLPEFFYSFGQAVLKLGRSLTWVSLGYTLLRLVIALAISMVCGVVLGIVAGYFPDFATVMNPLISFLRAVPTVAVMLLLVAFVPQASVYVVFLVQFPAIYQATKEGSEKAVRTFSMQMRLKGKHNITNFTHIVFPLTVDHVFLGLIQAFGLGFKAEIMAETFSYTTASFGMGKLIYNAYQNSLYTDMAAYVLITVAFVIIVDLSVNAIKKTVQNRMYRY